MSFSWVPFYRELAGKVLEFENRQDELIAILREMREEGFVGNTTTTLDAIDPFTFFAILNGLGEPRRISACKELAGRWNLEEEIPSDFAGVPQITAQNCWFFPYAQDRAVDDMAKLWETARTVYKLSPEEVDPQLLARCLKIKTVKLGKITIGFFYMNPENYLPIEKQMRGFYERKHLPLDLKSLEKGDWTAYIRFLKHAKETFKEDFPSISSEAWETRKTETPIEPTLSALLGHEVKTFPLNQILYGPPGTGKTYNSIRRAVEIIDGTIGENPVKRFEELRKSGQIGFVTFHQSFSYEEFIEGLRPVIGEENGQVNYEIRAGILKEMALRAIGEGLEKTDAQRATFEQVWNAFLEKVEDENWRLPGLGTSKYQIVVTPMGNITGENVTGKAKNPYNGSRAKIEKIWRELRDGPVATHNLIIGILGIGSHSNLIGAVVEELKRIEKEKPLQAIAIPQKSETIAQSYLKGSTDYRANFQNAERFVLIIDEINRGNISKILGELITLLEDDKRIGKENELRLTLPTSGETFALPLNLYILGTMNTSDKSLAQLDVALRRRFEFEEMAPNLDLCDKFPDQIPVLQKLNDRLEWALDREHRLGHSYFMRVTSAEEFDAVFRSKVFPLLLEYFPHDFQTLRAVLGEKSEGFLREFNKPDDFVGGGKKYRWWFEVGAEDFSAFAQLKSNYGL